MASCASKTVNREDSLETRDDHVRRRHCAVEHGAFPAENPDSGLERGRGYRRAGGSSPVPTGDRAKNTRRSLQTRLALVARQHVLRSIQQAAAMEGTHCAVPRRTFGAD